MTTTREVGGEGSPASVPARPPEADDALGRRGWTAGLRRAVTGVRARVLVWYLALFAASLLVAVLTIRQVLVARLAADTDEALVQEVEELRLLAGGNDPETGEPFADDAAAIFDTFLARNVPSPGEGFFFLVDDRPFRTSFGAPVDLLDSPDLVRQWRAVDAPTWGDAATRAGPARWLAVPVDAGEETIGTAIVARFYGPEEDEIAIAVRVMIGVSLGVLVLASLLGWATAGRVVAPIRTLTRTARHISDHDLSARIAVQGRDEVAELTATFNAMLERLEHSFSAQRRFLDDLGHELRTPLTILRGQLELLPEDPIERAETISVCLDEVDRMNRYVSDLVLLAKVEQPDFLRVEPVDLGEITDGMASRARALAPDRDWRVDAAPAVVVTVDPERVTQAWLNLVTNAVHHTRAGDEIRLGASVTGGEARIWVRDSGPGVAADDRDRIFERFGRGGDTGSRRDEGTGLGLAIVSAIARAHGGRVELAPDRGDGACFEVVLPARPGEGADVAPPTPAAAVDGAPGTPPVEVPDEEGPA